MSRLISIRRARQKDFRHINCPDGDPPKPKKACAPSSRAQASGASSRLV